MKKNYFFSLALVFMAGLVFSQPTITYNGNCPQIGDIYYQSYFDQPVSPGPSGENQTWNFTNLDIFETGEYLAMDPDDTPFGNIFTESNIAFNYNNEEIYHFGYSTSSESVNNGTGFVNKSDMIIHYSNPATLMQYPFSYNSSFTDSYYGAYVYEGLETHESGGVYTLADGWGNITTPAGTYNNVLRVKTERDHVDSVWMEGIFIYATTINYIDYAWYAPDVRLPVFAITLSNCMGVCDTVGYYTTSTQQIPDAYQSISQLKISPNPANEIVHINFEIDQINPIQISIIDITGKIIYKNNYIPISLGLQKVNIQLNNIDAGLYFLSLSDNNKSISNKIMIW
jgi:hypothetical protein